MRKFLPSLEGYFLCFLCLFLKKQPFLGLIPTAPRPEAYFGSLMYETLVG